MPTEELITSNETKEVVEGSSDSTQQPSSTDLISKQEVENLLKALKAERDSRKILERDIREKSEQLKRFEDVNPQEYRKLQEEAAIAAQERAVAEERVSLLEEKYGAQTAEAKKLADAANRELQEFRKRYALEKVFFAAGGRTDSADGISFFDLLADKLGSSFRLEPGGTVTVIDSSGDPVLDENGKRIAPEEYLSQFKSHPVYGTMFKGSKGSGAGIGFGGTDASGLTSEDLSGLKGDELFLRAFG